MSVSLRREEANRGPVITRIEGGGFRTQDHYFVDGVLLFPDRAEPWCGTGEADSLDIVALAPLLALDPPPEFIVLGTGTAQHFVPALRRALEERGIGLEAMDSRAAARAWGVLRAEDRHIAGLLLPIE